MQSQPDSSYGLPLETGGPSCPALSQLLLFLFLEGENQKEDQTWCVCVISNVYLCFFFFCFFFNHKKHKKHQPRQSSRTAATYQCMLTPTHTQRCVTQRYYDSQMILYCTFFTCNNLLFHKDEAEFHFRISAIFQQRHEDLFTFHSFRILSIHYPD